MATSSFEPLLYFGVEMEMLIRPRSSLMAILSSEYNWESGVTPATPDSNRRARNRRALHQAVAEILTSGGVPATTSAGDYRDWTVADDGSIDESVEFWRVEMVSKVMSSADPWQRQIDMLFEELSKYCEIRLNRDCAMHIHVSPSLDPARGYKLDDLKMIMKGIAYFDDAIAKIMPADRKENPWAVSNFNSREAPRDLYNAYAQVPYASWGPLFQRIDGIKMKQLVFRALGENRNMSWNFGNITSQCGTVEFRRPPGVQSAAAAKHWAAFTLSFIAQAMSEDWSQKQSAKEHPKVQRLLLFLVDGVNKLERASKNALNSSLIREDHSAPAVYSTAALQTIGAKMADKRRKGSVFVTKANSRPSSPASRGSSPGGSSSSGRSRR